VCEGDSAPAQCDNDHSGLDNSHLLEFAVQTKLGCDFGYDVLAGEATSDATIWQDEHALWWGVQQFVSSPGTNDGNENSEGDMLSWTGTVLGAESWAAATPKPSPYVFVYSSTSCTGTDSTGTDGQVGMRWGSGQAVVTPSADNDAVVSVGQVKALVEEASLTLAEEMMAHEDYSLMNLEKEVEEYESKSEQNSATANIAFGFALFASILGAMLTGVGLGIYAWRKKNPRQFASALIPDYAHSDMTVNKITDGTEMS